MPYPRHHTIDNHLRKVRLHTEPYIAEILGKEIVILPNVMSPKYDRSSQIFINLMPSQKGKTFLEIGSGTGIVSLFAALQGAINVTAVDINEAAIENTKINFDNYNLQNAEVSKSDLFSNVQGTYDTIFFNAPFHGNKPMDILELGTSDYNYETLQRFFEEVTKYLNDRGQVLLGFSDMGDNKLVEQCVNNSGLHIDSLQKQENGDWVAYLYTFKVPGGKRCQEPL